MMVFRAFLIALLLILFGCIHFAYAGCSEYIGWATINEVNVHSQGNNPDYYVEIKSLSSAILAAAPYLWNDWTLDICSDEGDSATNASACVYDISLSAGLLDGSWLILDEDDINWDYLDLNAGNNHGMEMILRDGDGDVVDYLSVSGYSSAGDESCTYLYGTDYGGGNGFNIQRTPDGVGDWDDTGSGNSGDETENDTNDTVAVSSPDLSIADASASAGSQIVFTATLSEAFSEDVLIEYETVDTSGTAVAGTDYTAQSGNITLTAGETTVDITVETSLTATANSYFYLTLTRVTSTNATITNNLAVGTILVAAVAEYLFDTCAESSAIIDGSGYGFDGTVLNGPLSIEAGKLCNAARFDGVDDYVEIDDSDLFDGTGELTILGWINPEDIYTPPDGTNARGIISKRNNASSDVAYGIFFYSAQKDGLLYVDIDTTNNRFASNSVIQEEEWTHFAVTFNGSLPADERVKLYINGVLDKTAYEDSATIPDYSSNLYLGNLYYGISQLKTYKGLMDEIHIIPEALDQAEVLEYYNETRDECQSCSDDGLICFSDDFDRDDLGSNWGVANSLGSFGNPRIVDGKLRLTDASGSVATVAYLLRLFPGENNKIVYEFDHYAYAGTGADGMTVVLSDAEVTPVPGGYGGSLGYAQRSGIVGFAGGWLGVGIDEFGNFSHDSEGRGAGDSSVTSFTQDAVAVRGSGSGSEGYFLHATSGTLTPEIDKNETGHQYRVTVDHTDNVHAYVTIERDISDGNGYQEVIASYDALAEDDQDKVPTNWLVSMTGSTGGATNIHEIDNLQVCATYMDGYENIDHYRIYHDGFGLTCSPEYVTAQACMDSDCSTTYAGEVTATLTAIPDSGDSWSLEQSFNSEESDNAYFRWTDAGEVTLGLSGGADYLANDSTRCFIGTVEQDDCSMEFYDSGFIFDVPDHVAAEEQSVTLAAVRKDESSEQCVPGFADVSRDLTLAYSYSNPGSGTLPVYVEGVSLDSSGIFALEFDNDGEAEIEVSYADVGEIALTATYSGSAETEDDGLTMTGSDIFVTYPDHFNLTVPGNPAAADAEGDVFTSAGTNFLVEVSAINAVGDVTPNYGQEADPGPESVSLTRVLFAPEGGANPSLSGSFGDFGSDCDGDSAGGYACGTFSWSEVGIITLTPQIADGEYLETGVNVTGDISANLGRFIPDRFTVSGNGPSFSDACSGEFTYLGHPFEYLIDPVLTLTAVAVDGSTTQNYGGDFWRYNASLANRAYSHSPASDGYTVYVDTYGAVSLTGDEDYDGTGEVTLSGDLIAYTKPSTAIPPFTTNIDLTLAASDLTDSDEVCYDYNNDDTCDVFTFSAIGDTQQRYGRMRIQNVYGPETLALQLPILSEYFSDGGYLLNTDDGCTALDVDAVDFVDGSYTGNLDEDETGVASGLESVTLSLGETTDFSLLAPEAGNDGSVDVTYSLSDMSWLQYDWDGDGALDDPTAKATFGIYQGNPHLIYMRESVW
jgi:MSHA biogenesis protein MshQ